MNPRWLMTLLVAAIILGSIGCKKKGDDWDEEEANPFGLNQQTTRATRNNTAPNFNPGGFQAPLPPDGIGQGMPNVNPMQGNQGGWQTLSHAGGNFKATFPAGNCVEQRLNIPVGNGENAPLIAYGQDGMQRAYLVSYCDYPPTINARGNEDTVLQGVMNGIMQGLKGKRTSERTLMIEGYAGREMTFTIGNSSGKARAFLIGNRLYQLMSFDSQANQANVNRFLDSFVLTNRNAPEAVPDFAPPAPNFPAPFPMGGPPPVPNFPNVPNLPTPNFPNFPSPPVPNFPNIQPPSFPKPPFNNPNFPVR